MKNRKKAVEKSIQNRSQNQIKFVQKIEQKTDLKKLIKYSRSKIHQIFNFFFNPTFW